MKTAQLLVDVTKELDKLKQSAEFDDVRDALDELVQEQRIAQVNYQLPSDPLGMASFWLPIGTQVVVKNEGRRAPDVAALKAALRYAIESERKAMDVQNEKWWTQEVLKLQSQIDHAERTPT